MRARINVVWSKWKDFTGIIYDNLMPRKLKVKIYEVVIRAVMLYGAEEWTVRWKEERMLKITETKMLCHIVGVTLWDRKRSGDIRRELRVDSITNKTQLARLRWYGHLQRLSE